MSNKIEPKTRLAILIILLLLCGGWFLSFYIKIPATGKGVGTHNANTDTRLKGVTYTGKNENMPTGAENSAFSDDEIKINPRQ